MAQTRPRVFVSNEDVAVSPLDLPVSVDYEPVAPEAYRDEMPVLGSHIKVDSEPPVGLTIQLPQELYDDYARIARAQELTVEQVIQHRLERCKSHNALRGLWFSDSERGTLENLLQKWPLETSTQAINLISRAAAVKFDDVQVTLTPVQKRFLSLAMFGGRTPQSFFEALVKKELKV